MEFNDIFENKRKYHRVYGQSKYDKDNRTHHYSYPTYHQNNVQNKWLFFLLKYRTTKTIRLFTKIAAITVIAIIIFLIIVLFPLIMNLAYYISQNGLQGVADSIMIFLEKLWKGFGK